VRGCWRRTWTWEIEADILVGKVGCGDGCEAIWARALALEDGLGVTHVEAHWIILGLFEYISI
jgi:hypothetical protein